MPEKVDKPVAGGNGYTMGGNHSQGIFSNMITSPFYPNFTVTETNGQETVKVRFTKGYVFDYSNSNTLLDPIPIKCPEEFTVVGQNTATAVYVMLTMLKSTGELVKDECKIVAEGGTDWVPKPDTNEYKRLPITSNVHTVQEPNIKASVTEFVNHESDDDKFKWFIKLADFENGDIKELYLRDNIHLNLLKIRQLGNANGGRPESNNEYPLIAHDEDFLEPDNELRETNRHFQGNGILPFIAIGKISNDDFDGENALTIQYDNEKGILRLGVDSDLWATPPPDDGDGG